MDPTGDRLDDADEVTGDGEDVTAGDAGAGTGDDSVIADDGDAGLGVEDPGSGSEPGGNSVLAAGGGGVEEDDPGIKSRHDGVILGDDPTGDPDEGGGT
ncbi:MAG TPA: hypothetical protein VGB14_15925 [Acidimicrobiales bacterium]